MTYLELETFRQAFERFFKGNQQAVELCLDYFQVAHTWDDIIDKDAKLTDERVHMAFITLVHKIPNNPFYQSYQSELTPVLMNVVMQWLDANELDHGDDNDKDKAYMLRAGLYNLISHIALICGGYEWAKEVGVEIRRLYGETRQSVYEVKNA